MTITDDSLTERLDEGMNMSNESCTALLERIGEVGPIIRTHADAISEQRRIVPDVLDALRSAGVFRMPILRADGGLELNPMEIARVVEEISYHDGSTGWVSMICCDSGFYSALLPDASVASTIFSDIDSLTAGWLSPAGQAEEVEGGYLVTGRWSFGSGIMHSEHIVGGVLVMKNGEMVFGENGMPTYLAAILPTNDVQIHDVWHTTGLRGTSSNDYSVTNVFVPATHCFNPFNPPSDLPALHSYRGLIWSKLAGVPIGLLRRAIDEFIELANTKVLMPSMKHMKEEERVQVALAAAMATLDACHGLLDRVLGSIWASLETGAALSTDQRAALARAVTWIAQNARASIESLAEEAGTAAVMEKNVLERIRRDATMVTHHVVGQRKTYAVSAQLTLGLPQLFPIY
jgi:indole-3-acetate monooxygenase